MNRIDIEARDVLIAVDIQNDFCPGGALAVPEGDQVVEVINILNEKFLNTIFTADWHTAGHISFASSHSGKKTYETITLPYGEQILWPDHCIGGTSGANFHTALKTNRARIILRKGFHPSIDSYSTFFENDGVTRTGLEGYLRETKLERLFFAGLATDFCVLWSALDGRRLGFDVFVIEDACRGIDVDGSLQSSLLQMDKAGVRRIHSSQLMDEKNG